MLKKAIPAVALCSLLLVGCNTTTKTVPSNNETPMQDIKRDVREVTPHVNTPVGPTNGNGVNNNNNGINGTTNNGVNGNGTIQEPVTPNAQNKWIKEPNVNGEVINDGTMK